MKVLSLIDAISGGGGMVMYNIIKGTPQYEHLVICPGLSPSWQIGLPKMIRDSNINVYMACLQTRHEKVMMRAIEEKIMQFNPDIILNHWWRSSKIQMLNKFGKTKKVYGRAQTVLLSHNNDPSPSGYDMYISVSKYNSHFQTYANKDCKRGVVNHQIIYNGIDVDRFNVPKKKIDKDRFVIGRVSSLAKFKIPKDWISFINTFDIPNALHLIVGNGQRYQQMQGDIDSLRLKDKVQLLGEIPNTGDILPNMLARFDIICYITEKTEAFSLAMLEAMAASLPIVTMNEGGIPEQIVHGQTGFLCNNRQEVRRYCELLSKNPDLVEKMGLAAKERAQQFTIKKMCDQYQQLFEKLNSQGK